ncbi:MAG: hypothetical protein ACKD6N_00870 [Candidatus Bathyarchaeota archaeon]
MSRFKVKIHHSLPFILTIFLSIFFAQILLTTYGTPPLMLTFPVEHSFLFDALYFTLIMVFAGLVVYVLSKHRRVKILKVLISLSYFTIVFIFYIFYLPAFLWILGFFNPPLNLSVLFLICVVATLLTLYCIFIIRGLLRNILILVFASSLGTFFGFIIPTLSLITILLALSFYDIFAVGVGPIKKLVTLTDNRSKLVLTELTITYRELLIGLGDLFLYSSLIAHVYIFFSIETFMVCVTMIFLGIFLSLKMLEKRGLFPGLPIAIIPPLIVILISIFKSV